jgi:hypothetical protein
MKYKQLLNHNENTRKIEDEEKTKFLKCILEKMGVPVQEFWTSDEPLSIDQRIQLRDILSTYGIQVIDSLDGLFQIYVSGELVAEFYKPRYALKIDLRQIDPRKRPYIEMNIEHWSVFEDAENEQKIANMEDNGR